MKHKAINTKERFGRMVCLEDEIDSFLSHMGLDARMHDMKILEVWKEAVGEAISAYTAPVELRKNKLFVSAENAAWRYELSLRKQEIIEKLNRHLSKNLIKEIIFI